MEEQTSDDRCLRAVLGDETRSVTTGGQDQNGTSILLSCCGYGCNGDSLRGLCRAGLEGLEVIVQRWVADGVFSEEASFSHHQDCE